VSWVLSEDLLEVVMIREAIEQVALQLAMSTENREFQQILQAEVDKMHLAVPSTDWEGMLRAESGFHDAIYFFSQSKRLVQMWKHLRPTVIASFRNDRGYYASIDSVPGAHQLLLDKIVSGDQSVALAELRTHICPSSNRIGPNTSGPPIS
jgi:DNA-binding GntR family transcriptional regulator